MQYPPQSPDQAKHDYHDHFDKTKHNYLQKCFYVINLIKNKDYDLWENFHAQYCNTKPEESWELYSLLTEEYRKLITPKKKTKSVKAAPKATKAKAKAKVKVKSRAKKAA